MKRVGENNESNGIEELKNQLERVKLEKLKKEEEILRKELERTESSDEKKKEERKVYIGKENVDLDNLEEMEYPRIPTKVFKKKKKGIFKLIKSFFSFKSGEDLDGKVEFERGLKFPLLFLMKNDGYIDIIEGLKVNTLFTMREGKGNEKKGIILSSKKLHTINLEPYPKCWIANEDEMLPYPQDVLYDAGEFVKIVRKIETTKGLLKDESKLLNAKMWYIIAIIGAIFFFAYFGFREGWFDKILGKFVLGMLKGGLNGII